MYLQFNGVTFKRKYMRGPLRNTRIIHMMRIYSSFLDGGKEDDLEVLEVLKFELL